MKFLWKQRLFITLFSFVLTLVFGSEIPWGNLSNICFSRPLAKAILYDISVGVFSSMIIVWCIDMIQQKMAEREDAKRRLILYNKISPLLERYYDFFLFLYIATRNDPVAPDSAVLKSLYLCKDEFIKQLYDTDPFYKDSYYAEARKVDLQMLLIQLNSDNKEEAGKIISKNKPWYQCWNIEAEKIYQGLTQIEKDFPTFFSNELLEKVDNLLALVELQANLVNFVEIRPLKPFIGETYAVPQIIPTEFFVDECKIEETLQELDSIMAYIEKDSLKKLRERSLDFFNNRNVSPTIGYTCAKQTEDSVEID